MDFTRQSVGMESASCFSPVHKMAGPPVERPSLASLSSQLDELTKQAEQLTGQTSALAERLCGSEPPMTGSAGQVSSVPNGLVNEIAQKLDRLRAILHAADNQLQRAHAVV